MNKLLSTTALVVALGVPALAVAQSADSGMTTQQQNGMGSGFMAARGPSDLFASELMGHDVYARRSNKTEAPETDDQAAATKGHVQVQGERKMNADGSLRMEMMTRSEVDNMDQIGQINEIVLSNDGQVRALVIGVGGFLGMSERDAAVTMDQISFMSDPDDKSEMYVVLTASSDMLSDAPEYDRTATRTSEKEGLDQRAGFTAPQMKRDGFTRIDTKDVSTEMLMGKSVYDTKENDVGSIDDMLLDEAGKITHVIIDFGGFLGMGSSKASVGYDELTILSNEDYSDVRVYVDATKAQIQDLPRYSAKN